MIRAKLFVGVSAALLTFSAISGGLAAEKRTTLGTGGSTATVRGTVTTGGGAAELSVQDCKAMGGTVAVHDGCSTVGGNEVGLKCTIGDYAACVDEATTN